jgi:nucleoside-diphosphate-sugar epimerase
MARLQQRGLAWTAWSRSGTHNTRRVDVLRDDLPALPEDLSAVIHLAAHAVPHHGFGPREAHENEQLCARVLEHLGTHRVRWVYASSAHVYAPSDTAHQETDPTGPQTLYGHSKLACERLCAHATQLDRRIARLFGSVGPGLPRGLMLTEALEQALAGANPIRMRGPDGWRDVLAVDDAAEALVRLAVEPTSLPQDEDGLHIVNVASGKPHRSSELVATMCAALPCRSPAGFAIAWPTGEAQPVLASVERCRNKLGFTPQASLEEALHALARHAYAAHHPH